jgi:HD-GYP domain-containing protein (c-di-GMP phosphodiesterase class II)
MASDRIRFQDGVSADPSQLDGAREYNKKLQDLGRSLVSSLYMLVRNVQLYDASNVIFEKPLQQLQECINLIIAMESSLSLQCAGDSFYLNNMLLRIDLKSTENVKALVREFEAKGVGGFVIEQPATTAELRNLIFIFSRANQEQTGERGVSGHKLQAIKLRRWEKLQEILQRQSDEQEQASEQADQSLDRKRYGLVVYARMVVFMRGHLAGLRGDGPQVPMGKCLRLIQDLVDVCHGHRTHFLGVSSVDKGEEYLAFHSVNCALLAIVFGSELGLEKERLRDLAVAALFHDIGKADLPEDLLNKAGVLTTAEKRQLARAPVLGAVRLLREGALSMRNIQCVLASYYHAADWGRAVKDHLGGLHHVACESDLGLFERIVAVVDCYDRLVFQNSLSPDLALVLMNGDLKHRFDPDLLRIFSHLMKGYTSKILSETGERLELF